MEGMEGGGGKKGEGTDRLIQSSCPETHQRSASGHDLQEASAQISHFPQGHALWQLPCAMNPSKPLVVLQPQLLVLPKHCVTVQRPLPVAVQGIPFLMGAKLRHIVHHAPCDCQGRSIFSPATNIISAI